MPARGAPRLSTKRDTPADSWPQTYSPASPAASSTQYTLEERARRDASPWTRVQGVLAAVRFLVFLVSLALVLRCFLTGDGARVANILVVIKTRTLYTIVVTGAIGRG